jgi:prepilin signal peptidase PulO-like enzyme (type II secretory pathway)
MLRPPRYNQVELAEVAALKALHALATSPYVRLRTSFCDQHRQYWTIKAIVLFGGCAMLFAAMLLTLVLALVATINRPEPHMGLSALAVIFALLGFFGWVVPLAIVWRNPIRAFGGEDGPIVVDNVSDAYAQAVEAMRPRAEPIRGEKNS